ncbi:MAG TPA: SIS domain-containing protein [Anaerolineae bacterium]|nr:SIS domain-containing protein [Anaerolineae bacterium]
MSSNQAVIESTLSFNFDAGAYEAAAEQPTYYRSLNQPPRREHPFQMYDAILRQPQLVAEVLATAAAAARDLAAEFAQRGVRRLLFSGIGASYHLGVSAAYAAWQLTGLPASWVDSSEALLSEAVHEYDGTAVIGLSASGNTIETVAHVQAARRAGAHTLALVNLDNTRLTEAAHRAYVAPGGYGLVWDYTTRLAMLTLAFIELGLALGRPAQPLEAVRAALADMPMQMQRTLAGIDARCQSIGRMIQSLRAVVAPAAGNQLPIAWEMALRFEEMAHFPARGRGLVDFLHGGVGYLAQDIGLVLLAPPGETYATSLRSARVAQTIKSPCVALVDEDDEAVSALADEVIRLPATHPALRPMLYLLPAQLVPYYTEVARPGGNPDVQRTDQPRYARAFDVAFPPKSH